LNFLKDLTSDGKFNIPAYNLEILKIQPFNQTLIPEDGDLEV